MRPRYESTLVITVKTWVLPTITVDMPSQQLTSNIRKIRSYLKLEESNFDTPAPVELLLGADVFPQVWIGEQ